jgi:acyl-CoA reductase-like NAD-dependent aldehyde dehydrogenase
LLHEKFDKIFFTGSTGTGRVVMAAAARHLTPVTLELGGKCPCIIAADAPIELTARRIVWGKFINAGQTCIAPDHLWVDRRIAAPLLDAMCVEIRRFYGENPQQSPDYGRIVNRRHFDRLQSLLTDGKIHHGGRTDADELYIEPSILTEVSLDSPAMSDEIFGPILPVMEFDDLTEVLANQRDLPPPLAVYLFTADRALQERVLEETRSGGVCINDTISHIIGNDLPFGGVGESGMGSYHGRASFECFSHPRSVLRRSLGIDPSFRYPPPKAPLETLKRVMRYFS